MDKGKNVGRYKVLVVNNQFLFREERNRNGELTVGKWRVYGGANPDIDYEYVTEGWADDFIGTAQRFPVRRSDGERVSLKDIAREVRIGDCLVVSPLESVSALEKSISAGKISTLSGRVSAIVSQPGVGVYMALSRCYDDPTPI